MQNNKEYLIKLKKVLTNKALVRLLMGGMSISSALAMVQNNNDRPLELSSAVYDSIQYDNDFVDSEYYYSADTTDLLKWNQDKVDLSLTEKNLKQVNTLNIDVLKSDIKDLAYLTNLESLTLTNFGYLTDEDKEILSNLTNLKNVRIMLDNSLFKEECHDISWLNEGIQVEIKKDPELVFEDEYRDLNKSDIYKLFIYNLTYVMNEENNNRINVNIYDSEELKDLERWNKQLVDIVASFNFGENMAETDKIIKIVNYVTDAIDYDPDVSQSLKDGVITDKSRDYNNNLLRSLFDNNDGYGICCNYAALTTILGYYSNVDISYISGTYGDGERNGHAWCQYNTDDKTYLIDPTFLDKNLIYDTQKYNYYYTNEYQNGDPKMDMYKYYMYDSLFNESTANYTAKEEFNLNDKKTSSEVKDVEYVNINIDEYNKEVQKQNKKYGILALSYLLLLISNEMYNNQKEDKGKQKVLVK